MAGTTVITHQLPLLPLNLLRVQLKAGHAVKEQDWGLGSHPWLCIRPSLKPWHITYSISPVLPPLQAR